METLSIVVVVAAVLLSTFGVEFINNENRERPLKRGLFQIGVSLAMIVLLFTPLIHSMGRLAFPLTFICACVLGGNGLLDFAFGVYSERKGDAKRESRGTEAGKI